MKTLLLAMAALAAAGAARAQDPAQAQSLRHGRMLAGSYCGECHATDETGDSPNRAAPKFRMLAQRYPIDDLQETLAEGILTGHPAMPQFSFTASSVQDLVAYLKSIQVGRAVQAGAAH